MSIQVDIKDIIKELNNLTVDYVKQITSEATRYYNYKKKLYEGPVNPEKHKNNYILQIAIVMLKTTEVDRLNTYDVRNKFIEYMKNLNMFIKKVNYYSYVPEEDFDYSCITGVTKDITKKSLSMCSKKFVDKLFEHNGILKRQTNKGNKNLSISELNSFTLQMFKSTFKENSLSLQDIRRILNDTDHKQHTSKYITFSKDWSDALFYAIRQSMQGYRYLYLNTKNEDTKIHNNIVVVGEQSFDTPVDNYYRCNETERIVFTEKVDTNKISTDYLMKALVQAPLNSAISNHILKDYRLKSINIDSYINKLTAINKAIKDS